MKCFYHASDMDGWASAAIIAYYSGNYDKKDYIPVDYNKHKIENYIDKIAENEVVYISDYSFTDNTYSVLMNILSKTNNVIWNDHHSSSIELSHKYPHLNDIDGYRDHKYSGAYLIYKYYLYLNNENYTEDDIPLWLKYLSDWDTFEHKLGIETTYFKYGIDYDEYYTYPLSSQWKNLINHPQQHLTHVIRIGKIIYTYTMKDYAVFRKSNVFETELCGYKIAAINRCANSLIFGDLYNEYPIVSTFVYDGEKWKYSLYSSDKYGTIVDCSKIAEQYGGGGHRGAAGFVLDKLIYKKIKNI